MRVVDVLTPKRLKWALIAAPLLLAGIYYSFFAADRYVSESVVAVRQANQEQNQVPGATLLLAGINSPSREDTLYLRQYIHSLELLKRLDEKLDLRAHYETEVRDPFYRLYPGTSQEIFLEYYRGRIEVIFDDVTSLLTVRVQGFEADFSRKLNQAILQECERFVNDVSQRIAREQLSFAENELQHAAKRLQEAKKQILTFQTKNKVLDPLAQAQASTALTAELQATLAKQEAELRNLRSYLNDDSYQVQALQNQVQALRSQLNAERQRSTEEGGDTQINEKAAQFQDLSLQVGFAQDAYKLSLAAVENARLDATRKVKSLVVIEPPAKPEFAIYPRRIYNIVTLFLVCCLLYGVTRLVVATINEHQD